MSPIHNRFFCFDLTMKCARKRVAFSCSHNRPPPPRRPEIRQAGCPCFPPMERLHAKHLTKMTTQSEEWLVGGRDIGQSGSQSVESSTPLSHTPLSFWVSSLRWARGTWAITAAEGREKERMICWFFEPFSKAYGRLCLLQIPLLCKGHTETMHRGWGESVLEVLPHPALRQPLLQPLSPAGPPAAAPAPRRSAPPAAPLPGPWSSRPKPRGTETHVVVEVIKQRS